MRRQNYIIKGCNIALLFALFMLSGCVLKIAMGSSGGIIDNGFAVVNEEQDLGIAGASIANDLVCDAHIFNPRPLECILIEMPLNR
jgi:hypothetical protein